MNIRQYTGGMKRSNIHAVCSNLAVGFKTRKPRWERSKILRRGIKLSTGRILWTDCQTGAVTVE